jgi:aspartyl-tRNA(Asn)/glutamyl-tRNA(Gln) amidotransferase subunit B
MEQGSLRCDVNLSLRRSPTDEFGTRSETKNVNSLRSVERAVRYEIGRQAALLEAGGSVHQETRHWHEDTGVTTAGRSKEQAEDYRYFPEPDLVPIAPDATWVEELRATLPENPGARRLRLAAEWGLTDFEIDSVINAGVLDLVVATVAAGSDQVGARKWWMGELSRIANEQGIEPEALAITPAQVARLEALIAEGALNDKLARQVIEGVLAGEGDPDAVVAARGLAVVSDDGPLLAAIDDAIAANPDVVAKIQSGILPASGVIIGAVMKATKGQADAARVRELLFERLGVAPE